MVSYGLFLALFLLPPVAALAFIVRRQIDRTFLVTLGGVAVLALAYTGPWDNAIIVNGVWSYGRHQVLGMLIGHVPLEEFVFYVLQVCFAGLLTLAVLARTRS